MSLTLYINVEKECWSRLSRDLFLAFEPILRLSDYSKYEVQNILISRETC